MIKKKILFIPHVCSHESIFNRVHELAENLNPEKYQAYYLLWDSAGDFSIGEKIFIQLKNLFCMRRTVKEKIIYLQIPMLQFPRNSNFMRKFNSFCLNYIIQKWKIEGMVLSNPCYFNLNEISCDVKIYDFVDDFFSPNPLQGVSQELVEFQKKNVQSADSVTVITELLAEKIKKMFSGRIEIVYNGFYPEIMDQVSESDVECLKRELGIFGKRIYGYIGNLEPWVNLEKALEGFLQLNEKLPQSVFIVVGGDKNSEYVKTLERKYKNRESILFLGKVHRKKVYHYFKLLDVGVIPFEKSDFTNLAFPIKVLEYGYSGAKVIATPLLCLKKLNFSFVSYAESLEEWEICFLETGSENSEKARKETINYSWSAASKKMEEILTAKYAKNEDEYNGEE